MIRFLKGGLRTFLWVCLAVTALAGALGKPAPRTGARESGNPFIRNFSPREHGGEAQNWAIVQDPRGIIYVGNNQGVLEYDGVAWRLIQTPRKTMVRSLAVDGSGRVYVGAVGEIGYLDEDANGQSHFVSLNEQMEPSDRVFTDVWMSASTSEGMFFQTREALFLYAGGRFQTWKASTTFHVAFAVQDHLFVRQREVGLLEMVHGQLALIPGGERFARESVFAVLPLEDPKGSLLVCSRNLGLFRFGDQTLAPFATEADRFLKSNALYHGTRLSDGSYALATIQGGVAFIDAKGRLLRILDRISGLQGDNVKHLFDDGKGTLWMALDNGISRVEWLSPLSIFDERSGFTSTVWAIQRHQGSLYVATGQGVYRLETTAGSKGEPALGRAAFTALEGIKTQSLGFLSLEDALLVANAQGVFELRGDTVRVVRPSSNIAVSLHRSNVNPYRVFVGMQGGLASLRRNHPAASGWVDEGLIPGLKDDIYSMVETEDGRLWLGTATQGVVRLTFPKDWKGGSTEPAPTIERFREKQGLSALVLPHVHLLGGALVAATHQGIFRWEEGTGRFAPNPRFAGLFPEGPRWVKGIQEDSQGRVWLNSVNEFTGLQETGVALPQQDGSYRWNPVPFRRFGDFSMEAILVEPEEVVWFGGPDGIVRYDGHIPRDPERAFATLVRRVTKGGGLPLFGGEARKAKPVVPDIAHFEKVLRFEFAAPCFDLETANRYQLLLEGYDSAWSSWTKVAFKEYTNLPEGTYRFRVRARNVYGLVSQEGTYRFRILPPWYRTWWAYLGYLGLGSLAIYLGVRTRTRILRQRNLQLQIRIAEATWELSEREHLLREQAGTLERMNGELRILNDQKNQFMGIAAHDLRNPLSGIVLLAEMIEEADDREEVVRRARQIGKESQDMSQLIARFLDVTAIESGKIKAEPELFSLKGLTTQVAEWHGYRAREKNLDLQALLPEGDGMVFADPKFTKEVLDNLVSNAIKFSPPGGSVRICLKENDQSALLSVEDDGPGLTDDDKSRLFGRFTPLSAKPTGGEKSVGLGLSIAKHMVDAMGGRIWVDSAPGKGAAFRVEFPKKVG